MGDELRGAVLQGKEDALQGERGRQLDAGRDGDQQGLEEEEEWGDRPRGGSDTWEEKRKRK